MANVVLTPEYEAVKVTAVAVLTLPAVTENVAEVDPCGTVTLDGTVATEGDALIATVAPPLAAGELNAIVQLDVVEGSIDIGLHVRLFRMGV